MIMPTGAYAAYPERFVRQPPAPPELPTAVWINKPFEKGGRLSNPTSAVSHPG